VSSISANKAFETPSGSSTSTLTTSKPFPLPNAFHLKKSYPSQLSISPEEKVSELLDQRPNHMKPEYAVVDTNFVWVPEKSLLPRFEALVRAFKKKSKQMKQEQPKQKTRSSSPLL